MALLSQLYCQAFRACVLEALKFFQLQFQTTKELEVNGKLKPQLQ